MYGAYHDGSESCHGDEDQVHTDTSMDALLKLLFPFYWAGVYIPVLPPRLLDVIDAPYHILLVFNYDTFMSIYKVRAVRRDLLADLGKSRLDPPGFHFE